MRVDKKKNIRKVKSILVKNPLATEEEIAQKAKIGKWTAHRAKKEVEKSGLKDQKILEITETDKKIVELGQREIAKRLSDPAQLRMMRTTEISKIIKESTARYSLFRWSATDKNGGLKESEMLTESQIQKIFQQYQRNAHQ